MSAPIHPADRWIAAWNAIMALVWAAVAAVDARAWIAVAAHAALAALPALLGRAPADPPRVLRFLREAYPLLFIVPAWSELGWLHALRPAATADAFVIRIDALLPGPHLHDVWMPVMPALGFSELMHGIYLSYYLFIFLPPIVLAARGRMDDYRNWTYRLLVTYLGCFAFYAVFPVLGPRLFTEPFRGELTGGLLYGLVHGARELGDSPGTAFPSSHVAGVVTAAWLAARTLRRPWPAVFAIGAVLVSASTVYTRNHYTVDVLGGVAAALLLQLTVGQLFTAGLAPRRRRTPAPRSTIARPASLASAREGRCGS